MKLTVFKKFRKLALLLSLLLLAGAFSLNIFAAESQTPTTEPTPETIYQTNSESLQNKIGLLLALKQVNLATSAGTLANPYITIYENKLYTLNNRDILEMEETGNMIGRYYTQGVVSGELAKIYYTYIGDFNGEAKLAIDRVHSTENPDVPGLQEEIEKERDAATLEEKASLSYNNGGIYARMYYAVFNEKLKALKGASDSAEVTAILEKAHEDLTKCDDFSSGAQYQAILDNAKQAVTLQRNKEAAIEEISSALNILYSGNKDATDPILAAATEAINAPAVTTVAGLNEIILQTVVNELTALQEGEGDYTKSYLTALSNAVSALESSEEVLSPDQLLTEYPLKRATAEAKDALVSALAALPYGNGEEMLALAEMYNKENGIFEGCADQETLAFEEARAALHIELYEAYLEAEERICKYSGEETAPQAVTAYGAAKAELAAIDPAAQDASSLCQAALNSGKQTFNALVVDAEVTAYEKKHDVILKKDPAQLTTADKQALAVAIADLQSLTKEAKAALETKQTPDALQNKYIAILCKEVEATLGKDTALRTEYGDKLVAELNALTADGKADRLPALLNSAEQILLRADAVNRILDTYEEILADARYEGISDSNKKAIQETLEQALQAIMADKTSNADQLSEKITGHILNLKRAEAYGMIEAQAALKSDLADSAEDAIKSFVKDAKDTIATLTDLDEIGKLTEDTCFDIQKEQHISDLEKKTEEALREIGELDMLTDAEKQELSDQLKALCDQETESLRKQTDKASLDSAMEASLKKLTEAEEAAIGKNEEVRQAKKDEKKQALTDIYENAIAEIDKMTFLSEEERQKLKDEAEAAFNEGLEKIEEAHSISEIEAALTDAGAAIAEIEEQSVTQNKATGEGKKAEATQKLNNSAAAYKDQINSLEYLSKEEKAKYCEKINIKLDAFSDSLPSMADGDALALAVSEIDQAILNILEESEAKNLEHAKTAAIVSLKQSHQTLLDELSDYWFTKAEDLAKETAKADQALDQAIKAINACTKPEDVVQIRDSALAEIDSLTKAAKLSEDNSCVSALTPFVVGFGIACGVELLAFAILLVINKKKAKMTCYMPVTVLVAAAPLMPVPLAWTLTILLAVADLALAGAIVYLIVQLVAKRRLASEPIWPEDDYGEEYEEDNAEEIFPKNRGSVILKADQRPVAVPAKLPLRLRVKTTWKRLTSPAPKLQIEAKQQLIYLLPPAMPELLPAVTVDQADLMISNEDAFCYKETNILNTEVYTGKRKAWINIDRISRNFEAGDLVSLNTLKEKGLISQKAGYVKILGRGVLDKPLTVVAQNYSASAVKMIVLTGGSAILAEGARK